MNQQESTDTALEAASERLRGAGYRVTKQRLAVCAFLHGNVSHPTVDDIYAGVKDVFPRMSVATVYKSVASLIDIGLVKPISQGLAATVYDASTDEHAHFRCIHCNQITDVPIDQTAVARVELDHCEIIGSSLEFYGFCASCRRHKLGLAERD